LNTNNYKRCRQTVDDKVYSRKGNSPERKLRSASIIEIKGVKNT